MTPPLDLDLARAAVALPGWEWRPGMLTSSGERVLFRVSGGRLMMQPDDIRHDLDTVFEADGPRIILVDAQNPRVPDYRDPATAGCLLALLGPGVSAEVRTDGASVWNGMNWHHGTMLGEACIRAADARGGWGSR